MALNLIFQDSKHKENSKINNVIESANNILTADWTCKFNY